MTEHTDITRVRRQPPPLVAVEVAAHRVLSPRMLGLVFEGAGLQTLSPTEPAASVRLLVPSPGTDVLVIPEWNGNEFLLPDGQRPALRTFTPLHVDRDAGRLELQIVRHPGGAVSTWAETVAPGAAAAISGPGTGYSIDPEGERFVLLGDETAIPAVSDLLSALPSGANVDIHLEIVRPEAEIPLPKHPGADLTWHISSGDAAPGSSLIGVAEDIEELSATTRLWAAGEAASMQAIRKHLFKTVGVSRSQATIRGYWKPARRPPA